MSPSSHPRRAFTLIEVLFALMFIGIVLPATMKGISIATAMAGDARYRTEAAALAQSKLAEIVAGSLWQNGGATSGDFGPDWPAYRWQFSLTPWTSDQTGQNMQELDLTVTYRSRQTNNAMTLSTLVYQRPTAQ